MFPAVLIWSWSEDVVVGRRRGWKTLLIANLTVLFVCLAFSIIFLFASKSYFSAQDTGSSTVPESVLDAIKLGIWDFEPEKHESNQYSSTHAMPGTHEKLAILSARVRQGLPLWHPDDRRTFDDTSDY